MKKYNPEFHSSVVRNLRSMFASEHPDVELNLSDEQIWDCHEESYFMDNADEEAVEMMKELNE